MQNLHFAVRSVFLAVGVAALGACGSSGSGPASTASPDAGADGAGGITGLTPSTWKWVPVPGTFCRDGSATGIGINLGSKSDKVMIYLEGGGACFNPILCTVMNPSHFDASTFATQLGVEGSRGIFNRTDPKNPVADWNFVYIPYCTGDIHAGNNPSGMVPGLAGVQKFVGYANVGKDLEKIVPEFPAVKQVLLTGTSAGGFGAAANYVQVAKAFPSVPVFMLDDSGPALEDPYNATCLQAEVSTLWGLDKGSLLDCGSDCTKPASLQMDFAKHVAKAYPNVPFALIESTQDATIRSFYGFGTNNGANDCNGSLGTSEDAALFTAGLRDLEAQTKGIPNFGSFIFDSTQHTSLLTSLDTESTPANGVPDSGTDVMLSDWITQFLAGHVSNVGLPPAAAGDAGQD